MPEDYEVRPLKTYEELCRFVDVATDPFIFNGMKDDLIETHEFKANLFQQVKGTEYIYLGLFHKGEIVGIVIHRILYRYVWEAHAGVLRNYRGKAVKIFDALWHKWIRTQPVFLILSFFAESNIYAKAHTIQLGFKKIGDLPMCFSRNNELNNMELWGYSLIGEK